MKIFAIAVMALAFTASAFASKKPTVTDFQIVPNGPFTRSGVAPYNYYFSPSTISRDGSNVAVVVEAVPVDGTPIRYSAEGFKCDTNQYVYETYDSNTDTWSELSDLQDIVPLSANAYLKPLVCR
jgi:inorganic pyrophosphatase